MKARGSTKRSMMAAVVLAVAATAAAGVLLAVRATPASGDPEVFRANKIAILQREQRDAAARAVGPRLSDSQRANPDPATALPMRPRTAIVYWRAACPPGPCERQVPPLADEGKTFATNNYYLGFDGASAWSLYARWNLTTARGVLWLDGISGRHQVELLPDKGVPTLTEVTPLQARFTTSNGHAGMLDLVTLAVTFTQ